MRPQARFLSSVGVVLLSLLANCQTSDWPPMLDTRNPVTKSLDGRTIERYVHGRRIEWGYKSDANTKWSYPPAQETGAEQQNQNSFYVVLPSKPQENAPLYVVLHSANRTAYDYLGYAFLNRKLDAKDDPATAMTNVPDGFYGLYLNSTNAEWWGWSQAKENLRHEMEGPVPAERRVLDTIEWVVEHYKIDRNRIYLAGVSMGGNGTLAIGMAHGDVFAAVRATVPAGTGYASYLAGGFAPSPAFDASSAERDAWVWRASGVGRADPPVIVDFSSPLDSWSITQPALVQAAQAGHLPLVLTWGPFGHATFASLIAKSPLCQVGLEFPWLEVRKNKAYPAFTRANTDQRSPWLNAAADFDDSGQMNAYFRWTNLADAPAEFSIRLWIAHPPVPQLAMPDSSTTDVTLRRLQRFRVQPGMWYAWQLAREGRVVASGKVIPDGTDLLTIPRLTLTTAPAELSIRPNVQ